MVEDTWFFRSLHREAEIIDAELIRGMTPWNDFADPGATARKTERVVEIPWVVSRIGSPQRLLDVGSTFAPRVYTRALARRDIGELHGIDLSPGTVPGLTMTQADIRHMPFPDAHFDVVVCISTLEHIGHDNTRYATGERDAAGQGETALGEMERVLRPGGRLLVTVPFGESGDYGWFTQYDIATWTHLVGSTALQSEERDLYRLTVGGWMRCLPQDVPHGRYKQHGAPAATAVLCAVLTRPHGN
jgi:SAM-dependent methyltransferase